jgi:DNA topoisomerase-1
MTRKLPSPPIDEGLAPLGDPTVAARAAGLRYTSDRSPGVTRVRSGKGFRYLDADGKPVRDRDVLKRIRSLAIPPAWTEVWICPRGDGHLQATGRDARGRKQYRYHPRWREVRDEAKYDRMAAFGRALPVIRARTEEDLARPGLPREKVLATVVRLLERTLIRVGNEEYAQSNGSYGLTTLRERHVEVSGEKIHFAFRGKSGVKHRIDVHDARLAKVVRRCRDLPGQELFQYVDDEGQTRAVTSADVNDYLREITGEDFTAKDFRTWAGTVLAAVSLRDLEAFESLAEARRNVARAIDAVSSRLGNTAAVCRKCYVHPAVLEAYTDGSLAASLRRAREGCEGLEPDERALLSFLGRRLAG